MSTSDRPHLHGIMQPSEGHELPEVGSISALRFLILDVGKPFELRWNLGEPVVLGRRQLTRGGRSHVPDLNQVIFHVAPRVSMTPYPDIPNMIMYFIVL